MPTSSALRQRMTVHPDHPLRWHPNIWRRSPSAVSPALLPRVQPSAECRTPTLGPRHAGAVPSGGVKSNWSLRPEVTMRLPVTVRGT
jgi:hypothetical protein